VGGQPWKEEMVALGPLDEQYAYHFCQTVTDLVTIQYHLRIVSPSSVEFGIIPSFYRFTSA